MPPSPNRKTYAIRARDALGNSRIYPSASALGRVTGERYSQVIAQIDKGTPSPKSNLTYEYVAPPARPRSYNIHLSILPSLKEALLNDFYSRGLNKNSAQRWLTFELERLLRTKYGSLGEDLAGDE